MTDAPANTDRLCRWCSDPRVVAIWSHYGWLCEACYADMVREKGRY